MIFSEINFSCRLNWPGKKQWPPCAHPATVNRLHRSFFPLLSSEGESCASVSISLKLPALFAWPKNSLGGPLGRDHCSQTLGFPALDLVPQSCPAWSRDCGPRAPGAQSAQGRPGLLHTQGTEISTSLQFCPLTSRMFNFGPLIKGKRLVAAKCEISVNK